MIEWSSKLEKKCVSKIIKGKCEVILVCHLCKSKHSDGLCMAYSTRLDIEAYEACIVDGTWNWTVELWVTGLF